MRGIISQPKHPTDRVLFWLLWLLRVDIVVGTVWMLILGNWEAFFITIMALALTFAPNLVARKYNLKLPLDYIFAIVLFIYLSMFLGSVFEAYERFFWWDAILHIASGVMLSYAVFLILYVLHKNKKMVMSPFLIAVFSFSFGLAMGAVWEIFEFAVDSIFDTNMQRSGLQDTMWDLIVDAAGSLVVAVAGYDIIKNNRHRGFMYQVIDRYTKNNE